MQIAKPVDKALQQKQIYETYKGHLFLSVSKMKAFESCRLKYKYTYIDKLPKKERDFQIFGKFLHEVLEKFQKSIIAGDVRKDNVIMKDCFASGLENYNTKLTEEQKKDCFAIAVKYIEKRAAERAANVLGTPLFVERPFNIDIDGKVLLNGFIDFIMVDHDGTLHVADYKTSKDTKYLAKDFTQLKVYAYVMCLEDPTLQKVRCSYIMLKHNFISIVKEYTRNEIMGIQDVFLERYKDILDEKLFRPSTSPLCAFCDGLEICESGKQFVEKIKRRKNGNSGNNGPDKPVESLW